MQARGGRLRRLLRLALLSALAALITPSTAGAATQVGQIFTPNAAGCGGTFVQTGSPNNQYLIPFTGVITAWQHLATGSASQYRLKVARFAGGNSYTIVGESALETTSPPGPNSFTTRIPVQAGDTLGAFFSGSGGCVSSPVPGYTHKAIGGDQPVNATVDFGPGSGTSQLDISATLEADCDNDGFGDETQDGDTSMCAPPEPLAGDTNAPDGTITGGPRDRTRKRNTTFTFNGSDPTRAVASFQCSLDGAAFAPCASPYSVRVRRGRHSFAVQAIDDSGNVDATPAMDDWKVRKKKQRR